MFWRYKQLNLKWACLQLHNISVSISVPQITQFLILLLIYQEFKRLRRDYNKFKLFTIRRSRDLLPLIISMNGFTRVISVCHVSTRIRLITLTNHYHSSNRVTLFYDNSDLQTLYPTLKNHFITLFLQRNFVSEGENQPVSACSMFAASLLLMQA